MHRPLTAILTALLTASAAVAATAPVGAAAPHDRADGAVEARQAAPRLSVRAIMTGLDIPWDVTFLPSGAMLVTERDRERILYRAPNGTRRVVADTPPGVWHEGETGMMGIVADPRFGRNRHFFTCNGFKNATTQDVRVMLWRLNDTATRAVRIRPIVTGLPSNLGHHGGCRLRFDRRGALYIGTGDAGIYTTPQSLHSLGGKVLRVDRHTGGGLPGNPFPNAADPDKRRIYTYGHRNVQGLAQRPRGLMWSVEHGPDRDDEVNRLVAGGNYGWDPGPGYDQNVPMTDFTLPGPQIGARWSSGEPADATSGASWLRGARWGSWEGRLAVAALKDSSLRVMQFSKAGRLVSVALPARLNQTYGRLRSPQLGPHGALYITTSNGGGVDKVLRVVPQLP
ncbi:MAG TPA: PQQ-dependent sugar dehydrogenase [Nocardioidaceae bacterium]|nr:PQQ-dependent sugar dehydrogenase [Nocardioidaceae bacterium]